MHKVLKMRERCEGNNSIIIIGHEVAMPLVAKYGHFIGL